MRLRRSRVVFCVLGAVAAMAMVAAACTDDGVAQPTDAGPGGDDAGRDAQDSAPPAVDASPPAVPDSGPAPDASRPDAAPTVTESIGPTGQIDVASSDGVSADFFFEDDTIVRASDAPECVAFIRSETKPTTPQAGTLTVAGSLITWDGGPGRPIVLPTPAEGYVYPGPVFPEDGGYTVQVDKAATSTFPAIAPRVYPAPAVTKVTVTAPVAPDGGALQVPSNQDLVSSWTIPANAAGLQMHLRIGGLTANAKLAALYCSYPLSAGTAKVPATLLTAIRTRLGAQANDALLDFYVGRAEEVAVGKSSYLITVSRTSSTNINPGDLSTISVTLK